MSEPTPMPELAELRGMSRAQRRAALLDLLWDAAAAGTLDEVPAWVEGALILVGAETLDTFASVAESFLLPHPLPGAPDGAR